MAKQLMFDQDARTSILKRVNILSDAAKAALGPKGRNVPRGASAAISIMNLPRRRPRWDRSASRRGYICGILEQSDLAA
jgi:hypothetical protein